MCNPTRQLRTTALEYLWLLDFKKKFFLNLRLLFAPKEFNHILRKWPKSLGPESKLEAVSLKDIVALNSSARKPKEHLLKSYYKPDPGYKL